MFEFVFKMFSEADTTVPSKGMGCISQQLAEGLTNHELLLNERVIAIEGNKLYTSKDKAYESEKIIIATDAPALLLSVNDAQPLDKKGVLCLYFSADKPPYNKALIALNALPHKLVNNIAVMTNVSLELAPEGKVLIAVSIIHDQHKHYSKGLEDNVKNELSFWFPQANSWNYLTSYAIPHALPRDQSISFDLNEQAIKRSETLYVCGDHLMNGSINAAMKSGRLAAQAILTQ